MGPLEGIRVVEVAGIGPGPFCATLLADMGADVLRLERPDRVRPGPPGAPSGDLLCRGRRSAAVDLKSPAGVECALGLVERADVLLEGFRPGVMERLGLGPDVCAARNPRLVYGRMTGWGQEGPLAQAAGHDINYIALAGVLDHIGRDGDRPVPPLNLVGDFGGGGMFLAFGVVTALVERQRSGRGQVVDAAMVDGAAYLMAFIRGLNNAGAHSRTRGLNMLDGGAPFYEVYETSDGRHVSLGAIEPQFYAELVERLGLDPASLPAQNDAAGWPETKRRLAELFLTRTRDEWCELLEGSDACFAPVLGMDEAPAHPHAKYREAFPENRGVVQPAPAPRFSRTSPELGLPPCRPGEHTDEALRDWGVADGEIERLREAKVIA